MRAIETRNSYCATVSFVLDVLLTKERKLRAWQKMAGYLNRYCVDFLDLSGSEAVLSVGIGEASLEADILRRFSGLELMGVDINPHSLKQAKEWEKLGLASLLFRADGAALPFPSERFDVVYCRNVLKHAGDNTAFISEMCRVIRPGGKVVVIETVALDSDHQSFLNKVAAIVEERQGRFLLDGELFSFLDRIVKEKGFQPDKRWDQSVFSFVGADYLGNLGIARNDTRAQQVLDLYRTELPPILLDSVAFLPSRENPWDVWSEQVWGFWSAFKK